MESNFFNFSKRKKRDLLFELLVGSTPEGIIGKKEINAVNRLLEGPPLFKAPAARGRRPTKTVKTAAEAPKNTRKKRKLTCYLAQEVFENLEQVRMSAHSLVPADLPSRISRSSIVNQALEVTFREFAAKGKESRLMRSILQKT